LKKAAAGALKMQSMRAKEISAGVPNILKEHALRSNDGFRRDHYLGLGQI
jgi:hypothetical protein